MSEATGQCDEVLCTTTTRHHVHTDVTGRSWCCGPYPYIAGQGDADWCPECAGHRTVRVWVDGYEYARKPCPACRPTPGGRTRPADTGDRDCLACTHMDGGVYCSNDSTCPRPATPVPHAEPTDGLREELARTLWHAQPEYFVSPWDEISETTRQQYRTKVDALLAGPLAPLLAKLQAVEALADDLTESGCNAQMAWVVRRIRRALGSAR